MAVTPEDAYVDGEDVNKDLVRELLSGLGDQIAAFQCRLDYSGGNLVLSRWGGRHLFINGRNELIPGGDVALAPTGIISGTFYYVYAYMDGATMTLERSTSPPVEDPTYGHHRKNGDATRTLVGASYAGGTGAWYNGLLATVSAYNRVFRRIIENIGNTSDTSAGATVKGNPVYVSTLNFPGAHPIEAQASGEILATTTDYAYADVSADGSLFGSARAYGRSAQAPFLAHAIAPHADGLHTMNFRLSRGTTAGTAAAYNVLLDVGAWV